MVVENGMMTMTQQMARTRTKPLTEKMKKEKIKAKKGDATVRITCSIDPGFESADFAMGWGAQLVWKAGGNLRSKYSAMTLSDIVGQVSSDIKKRLAGFQGTIPSVDVIFKMHLGSDHKLTIYYPTDIQIQEILSESRDGDLNAYE